eukprot:scaffold8_cov167-Amphora_coffeaeformis.AAC.3
MEQQEEESLSDDTVGSAERWVRVVLGKEESSSSPRRDSFLSEWMEELRLRNSFFMMPPLVADHCTNQLTN